MTVQNPFKWLKFLPVFLFLTQFNFIYSTVTQTPSTACVGDSISVSCVLTPTNDGDVFTATISRFIVGDSDTDISANDINNNIAHDGVDLSRMTAIISLGTNTRVIGSIILNSYLTSDEGLRLGCFIEYVKSGTMNVREFNETLRLNQAVPPFAPSLQSSVSNFNTATCSADISLTWNILPSDRTVDRYFLYLDGSPLFTTNSNSYIHSTILNINTDYQYSATAMSCAGNSTNSSSNVNSVASYSLMRSSQYVCLDYDNDTGGFTVNWALSTLIQPSGVSGLEVSYSLQLLYSHNRQGVTYTYTNSTSFTLPSSQLSYNTVLTAHNFTQLDGVETNITASLMIVQQCGQSFNGTAMECFFNQNDPPIPPTTYSILPNTTNSPSSILPNTTNTPSILPNTTNSPSSILPNTTNTSSILPNTTNTPSILPNTTNTSSILPNTTNTPSILPNTTNTPSILPNTTNTSSILPNTTNTPSILPNTTNTPSILPNTTNTPSILPNTTNTPLIPPNTTNSPSSILPNTTNSPSSILPNTTKTPSIIHTTTTTTNTSTIPPNITFSSITIVIIESAVGTIVTLVIILIILFALTIIIFRSKRRENHEYRGLNGSTTEKNLEGKKLKDNPENPDPVKKDEFKLHYLEIEHFPRAGNIVKLPTTPPTHYAEIDLIETNQ